jgi:hypothetical protein
MRENAMMEQSLGIGVIGARPSSGHFRLLLIMVALIEQ